MRDQNDRLDQAAHQLARRAGVVLAQSFLQILDLAAIDFSEIRMQPRRGRRGGREFRFQVEAAALEFPQFLRHPRRGRAVGQRVDQALDLPIDASMFGAQMGQVRSGARLQPIPFRRELLGGTGQGPSGDCGDRP